MTKHLGLIATTVVGPLVVALLGLIQVEPYSFWKNFLGLLLTWGPLVIWAQVAHNRLRNVLIWLVVAPALGNWLLDLAFRSFAETAEWNGPSLVRMTLATSAVWLYTALRAPTEQAKAAFSTWNAAFRTILGISFMIALVDEKALGTLLIPSEGALEMMKATGITLKTVADVLIKMATLPFVIAGLWAPAVLDIRTYDRKRSELVLRKAS